MTPNDIQELQQLLLQQERLTPQLNWLINHTKDLQLFLMDLTDWLAASPSPMKTATYYQIQARAQALRNEVMPPKPTRSPLVMM